MFHSLFFFLKGSWSKSNTVSHSTRQFKALFHSQGHGYFEPPPRCLREQKHSSTISHRSSSPAEGCCLAKESLSLPRTFSFLLPLLTLDCDSLLSLPMLLHRPQYATILLSSATPPYHNLSFSPPLALTLSVSYLTLSISSFLSAVLALHLTLHLGVLCLFPLSLPPPCLLTPICPQ